MQRTLARWMGVVAVRTKQYLGTGSLQLGDGAPKGRMSGLGGVEKRQGDEWQAEPDPLGEQAERQGVTDAERPLDERVGAGAADDDGVGRAQRIGSGCLYSDRTGYPVCDSSASRSMNFSACGVAITQTVHPRL